MSQEAATPTIVCVTLNPAVDRTLEVRALELGQHAKGRLVSRQPAGKAVNVARVLQHLGQPCILTGFVGEDERVMFEQSFDSSIVRTQLFGLAAPSRENITLVDAERGIETHVRDEGAEISPDDQERLLKKLRILAKEDTWMVFAGSLPRGLGVDAFREMLRTVSGRGARLVLDSSEGALGVVRKLPLWLIKPNRAELAALTGRKTGSTEEILAAIDSLDRVAETVCVSAGEDGCYLAAGDTVLHGHLDELPRKVTNTVGCGDALLAGLLTAMAAGLDAETCARRAVATGTSASFQVRAGDVDPVEVEALVPRIHVDRLRGSAR